MAAFGLTSILRNLKDSYKYSTLKHKDFITVVNSISTRPEIVIFKQEHHEKVLVDKSKIEKLSILASDLLDLDIKHSQHLQSLTENLKSLTRLKRISKTLKSNLLNLEKTLFKEKKNFTLFFEDMTNSFKSLCKNAIPTSIKPLEIKEKLMKVIKTLVHNEVICNYDKLIKCKLPIKLLNGFYLNAPSEEPELEVRSDRENKKVLAHVNVLTRHLEKVASDLLRIYWVDNKKPLIKLNDSDTKNYLESRWNKSISPNELKILKMKINRLHNRGSLTDDEAKSMLGKISILPISPDADKSLNVSYFKSTMENLNEIACEEDPVTETREKEQLAKSISKEISKRAKSFKRVKSFKPIGKRSNTPAKIHIRKSVK
ncbi:hypothetical protein SteCoe_10571 [Stentor coeruleus]|uniref:Uncharacterized protein n=1 Tax=Stentor coeruleus TaxID=5963 RepID=A0A1R2CFC6_9CILI|nr:hypothetical protein SteCoe_10571 [Stentor coeruleus]